MKNRWPNITPEFADGLDEIVFVSRLLGSDNDLVLHGGGNSSIKDIALDVAGTPVDSLFVKGSGWDLGTIERGGFTALRRDRLEMLLNLDSLSDPAMMNEFRQARIRADDADPSVETLMHALLPHRVVLHSHADALIAMMNQVGGEERLHEVFGASVLVLPYVMPGFDLARSARDIVRATDTSSLRGIILLHHGLFSFGDTARDAYDNHIDVISSAEAAFVSDLRVPPTEIPHLDATGRAELARFRQAISDTVGCPMIVTTSTSAGLQSFARAAAPGGPSDRGPATPDHVIRTKRVPLIGRDLDGYVRAYEQYFASNATRRAAKLQQLDPAPRVVLDPEWGALTVGKSAEESRIVADIYEHTAKIIERADAQGGYLALPAADVFDVEYWDLEQAKLRRERAGGAFAGQVALVTGAASGIGRSRAEALLAGGAAVVGLDLSPGIVNTFEGRSWLGIQADVSDSAALDDALTRTVLAFGGLDVLVPAAGLFTASTPIASGNRAAWLHSFAVNATAVALLFELAHPLLAVAPAGGRVALIATKNVAAPGPGASAYSASKAAAAQLARVAALEWAPDGIRVNLVHPDADFDTGLWTPELLRGRARRYGVSVDEYKRRNLLRLEITSRDVGTAVAALCSPTFRATTGANLPIDGGNDRVI